MEIKGIPKIKGEKYENVVNKLTKTISVEVNDHDIDASYRVANFHSNKTRSTMVKFRNHKMKQVFIKNARIKKATARDIGFANCPELIYVNKHLFQKKNKNCFTKHFNPRDSITGSIYGIIIGK